MADYTETVQGAYDAIADAGGPVVFQQAPAVAPPINEAMPWEGSDAEPEDFAHVAAFVPLSSLLGRSANPFAEAVLIPALGLHFVVEIGMTLRKADGTLVAISNVITIAPDGLTPILYQCEVNPWPGT